MHPVIELIENRRREGSQPGRRTDGCKLGLAIEGGGMRGIVTCGMATALERLGLLDAFDAVYGTSAGAFNAAYFVAGQSAYGGSIYYEDINDREFIDLRRWFRSKKPVMSLEYLVWEVVRQRKKLDCERIIGSRAQLVILVTSARELRAKRLSGFDSADQIYHALLATGRVPVVTGGPVRIDGEPFFDGGIFEPIPYHSAIDDGCSHVLALLSRPGEGSSMESGLLSRILERNLARRYPGMAEALELRRVSYPRNVAHLARKTASETGPPYLYAMQPPAHWPELDTFEQSRRALLAGAAVGFRMAHGLLTQQEIGESELLSILRPQSEEHPG